MGYSVYRNSTRTVRPLPIPLVVQNPSPLYFFLASNKSDAIGSDCLAVERESFTHSPASPDLAALSEAVLARNSPRQTLGAPPQWFLLWPFSR